MTEQNTNAKKGKPTPARKQQEAARKRPLIAPRTKESRQAEREALRQERIAARQGFASGDPKYLPKRDAGPQKALLRDIVDSRFVTVGEILMVVMVVTLVLSYSATPNNPISVILSDFVLVLFVLYLVDTVLLFLKSKKVLAKKFGSEKTERGIWFYVATRSMYPRIMRTPRPQVKRGHKF